MEPVMEEGLFTLTAVLALAGGLVIALRSRLRAGNILSLALGASALTHALLAGLSLHPAPALLRLTSLGELVTLALFISAFLHLAEQYARRQHLLVWIDRGLLAFCLLAGLILARFPFALAHTPDGPVWHLGWLGRAQAMVLLAGAVGYIWILENLLRSLRPDQRHAIRHPATGALIIGLSFVFQGVFRMSTVTLSSDALLLSATMTLVGTALLIFFSIRHKLFDMDIFVSRYVVYHSITVLAVGAYLFFMGLSMLGLRWLGIELSFFATGSLVFIILLLLTFILISPEARLRLRFFINTHFFANKYDYRKEWGALSRDLSIAFNTREIIHVTAGVILDSMYISDLSMWIKDGPRYRCRFSFPAATEAEFIAESSLLVRHLETHPYFLRKVPPGSGDEYWHRLITDHARLLDDFHISLAVPILAGKEMLGFIAVGPENPGTPYGGDDIDLLSAIALEAGAALMSARNAEKLAANQELDTFNRLSATVLHDLKNAAGNLSLILQNAPRHLNDPTFIQDMLEAVRESLARVDKVITRLGALPGEESCRADTVEAALLVDQVLGRIKPRLHGIHLIRQVEEDLNLRADREMLERILENLLVNAAEAASEGGQIILSARHGAHGPCFAVEDNGPGMDEDFLRTRLFRPFQTTKEKGTGLGLWQVRQMVNHLGGAIDVENHPGQGVIITITLPILCLAQEGGRT